MSIPEKPITREEMYLYRLATGTGEIPEYPVSRYEAYLDMLCKNGGGGGGGYSKAEIDRLLAEKGDKTDVEANTEAIDVLNGTGEGSVSKTINDKVAEIVAGAPEDLDTLKELSDWLYDHEDSAAAMNTAIQENTAAIANKTYDSLNDKPFDTIDSDSHIKVVDGALTEDIQIGGRNYLLNTLSILECHGGGNRIDKYYDNFPFADKKFAGKDCIISFDWEYVGDEFYEVDDMGFMLQSSGNGLLAYSHAIHITPENTSGHISEVVKASVTQTAAGTNGASGLRIRVMSTPSSGVIKLSNVKLEIGNKSTDWSPALEDMASKDDVARSIDDIQIGGRNYFKKSDFKNIEDANIWNPNIAAGSTIEVIDDYLKVCPGTEKSGNVFYRGGALPDDFELGYKYTLSFFARADEPREIHVLQESTPYSISIIFNLTKEWQYFTVTFRINERKTISFNNSENYRVNIPFYIKHPKLEKGNKATDWTPAPEDFEAKIAAIMEILERNNIL